MEFRLQAESLAFVTFRLKAELHASNLGQRLDQLINRRAPRRLGNADQQRVFHLRVIVVERHAADDLTVEQGARYFARRLRRRDDELIKEGRAETPAIAVEFSDLL